MKQLGSDCVLKSRVTMCQQHSHDAKRLLEQ